MSRKRMVLSNWEGTWGTLSPSQAGRMSDRLCKPINMVRYGNGLVGPVEEPLRVAVTTTTDPADDGGVQIFAVRDYALWAGGTLGTPGYGQFFKASDLANLGTATDFQIDATLTFIERVPRTIAILGFNDIVAEIGGEFFRLSNLTAGAPTVAAANDGVASVTEAATHNNRLYASAINQLHYNNFGTLTAIDNVQFVEVGSDGEFLQGLISMPWGLVIGRRDGIWLLSGTPEVGNLREISNIGLDRGLAQFGDVVVGRSYDDGGPVFVRGSAVERPLMDRIMYAGTVPRGAPSLLQFAGPLANSKSVVIPDDNVMLVNGMWSDIGAGEPYWLALTSDGYLLATIEGPHSGSPVADAYIDRMSIAYDRTPEEGVGAGPRVDPTDCQFHLPQLNPEGNTGVRPTRIVAHGKSWPNGGNGRLDCAVYTRGDYDVSDGVTTAESSWLTGTQTWTDPGSEIDVSVEFRPAGLNFGTDFQVVFDAVNNFAFDRVVIWYDAKDEIDPS